MKAHSGDVTYPANNYIAYAKRWSVGWDYVPPEKSRVRTYSVDVRHMRVYDDADDCGFDGQWLMQMRINEHWIYPVTGSGEHGRAFFEDKAIDDEDCLGENHTYKEYKVGVHRTVQIVPGEDLHVVDRAYDIDPLTTTVVDEGLSPTDETPPVDLARRMPESLEGKKERLFEAGLANPAYDGAHTLGFNVTDETEFAAHGSLLGSGTDPIVVTNGQLRYAPGDVPAQVEYRYWRNGKPVPDDWNIVTPPMAAGLYAATLPLPTAASANGSYTVEVAGIRRLTDGSRVVGQRDRYQVELQNSQTGEPGGHGLTWWAIRGGVAVALVVVAGIGLLVARRR